MQVQDQHGGYQSIGSRSRRSQKNRDGIIRSSHGRKAGQKVINLNLDVKLSKAENAWKPGVTSQEDKQTPEEKKTQEVFKKVRSILNKLAPQSFETLLNQFRDLEIDSTERLKGSIDLIFEKAIDEPSYAVVYSMLCNKLANVSDMNVTV